MSKLQELKRTERRKWMGRMNVELLVHHVTSKLLKVNIQQLYALPTLYLCVLYLSEDKQRLVALTA